MLSANRALMMPSTLSRSCGLVSFSASIAMSSVAMLLLLSASPTKLSSSVSVDNSNSELPAMPLLL